MTHLLFVVTKTYTKRAWLAAVLAVCLLVLGPLSLRELIYLLEGPTDSGSVNPFHFHFAFLATSWVTFIAVCLHALHGSQLMIRGLPLSSARIASGLMFSSVGIVVLLSLVTNGLYRLVFFDEHWLADYWPVLGPLLFLCTLVMVGYHCFWSMHAPGFLKVAGWGTAFGLLFFWFVARYYPNGFVRGIVPWSHVTLGEFVTLQLVSLVAWLGGVRAFANIRNGAATPSPQWEQAQLWWTALITGRIPERLSVPLSRRMTLARLHWSGSCQRAVIVGGVLFGVAVLIVNLASVVMYDSSSPELNHLLELSGTFQITTLVLSGIAAIGVVIMLAGSLAGTGNTEMNRFLAMTPLSDRELSATMFGNMAKTILFVVVLIQLALLLSYAGFLMIQGTEIFHSTYDLNDWLRQNLIYSSVAMIGFWILAANLLSLCWTGRQWLCNTVVGVVIVGNIAYVIIEQLLLASGSYQAVQALGTIIFLVYSLVIISATIGAYLDASKRCLIQKRTRQVALYFSLTGLVLFELWMSQQPTMPDHWIGFLGLTVLLALIFAPFATIPLAISWNRHR
ncbi:hypothetical protein Mal35_55070 [Gimesia maris]|uniref:hypothetical protein n=1 Tax=Gimesia maris TaxID=122 RepID=UPI00118B3A12|nr:hypothetical protein [Gimesia maris]QDT82016.1 hypothetical protein Mal35_55070 [Gimesia maris]